MKEIFARWVRLMQEYYPDDWRLGQTLFQAVDECRPDLAERLQKTEGGRLCDPFYDDSKVGALLGWLYEQGVR